MQSRGSGGEAPRKFFRDHALQTLVSENMGNALFTIFGAGRPSFEGCIFHVLGCGHLPRIRAIQAAGFRCVVYILAQTGQISLFSDLVFPE